MSGLAQEDKTRDSYLRRTHNITLAEYNTTLSFQGGHCAICSAIPKIRSLHVDHDHKTGKVRGILCYTCNKRLLPAGKDNLGIFRAAAEYLENPPFITLFGIRIQTTIKKRRKKKARKPV